MSWKSFLLALAQGGEVHEKKAEGIAEGKAEEQKRIIHNMMQAGLDDQIIISCVADVTEEQMTRMRQEWAAQKCKCIEVSVKRMLKQVFGRVYTRLS